jgi:O-acetyl-ADP-ribose deacetylase (regulator of RNase III)
MIKEVSGDILFSKAEAIAHGIAPFDHFDSGLALSLRERWPDLYKDFRHYCHVNNPPTGAAWTWKAKGHKPVVNLMTQEAPAGSNHNGRPGRASEIHVNRALKELKKIVEKEGYKSVALPRLATGVGGLDWDTVRPMVYDILGDLPADVYVYTTYVKDFQASES